MNKVGNPRASATEVLGRWEKEKLPIDRLLAEVSHQDFSDPRDFQLFRALVVGVIRWLGYLDYLLEKYSTHPLKKMKPLTRQALRVGLFQLLFMDRVPVSAAINETVKILKEKRQPRWLTGFVNGLLRRVSREKDQLPQPGEISGSEANYALFSHPRWLFDRWAVRYGQEKTADLCLANNREADLCLRVNGISRDGFLEQLQEEGIAARGGLFSTQAVILENYRGRISELPGYPEGLFLVQDEAAQLATGLFGGKLRAGLYLDACAGLGGKTTHLAAIIPAGSRLVAVEPDLKRHELLLENLRRLGLVDSVEMRQCRLEDLLPEESRFQGILVDAPCSGTGAIRRHPDIRWNRKEADLQRYQAKQLALLQVAAGLLEPGGVLVYVTCSIEPEENEQVVEKFLAAHADFKAENCRDYLPAMAAKLADENGFFRTLPNQGLDGFFGARFKKNEELKMKNE